MVSGLRQPVDDATGESPAHDVPVGDYPLADIVDTDAAVAAARRVFDEGP